LDCKKVFIKHVIDDLAPAHERRRQYENKPEELEEILARGNQVAQTKAAETMAEVRAAVGL
jgi:tryptophanyl-tRNA synthetase